MLDNLTLFAADATEKAGSAVVLLGRLDITIIVFYFILVLTIGWYLKGRATSGEDFFMAGREMTAWIAGLSFLSANLGSLELMGWAAASYQYGILATHWYWVGAIPAMLFLGIVMMPFYYISKTHSVPGYLQLRFGESSRALAAISFGGMTILMSGINMFAMAKVMKVILGWDMHFSIWVSSITVAVYVALGGLRSAIFNEILQFVLIWIGALLIPILGLYEAGGWEPLKVRITDNVAKVFGNADGAQYTSLWSTLGAFEDNPMGIHWTGIVLGLGWVISFGYWTTDFLVVQRVLAAKDIRAAKMAPIIGAGFKMMVPFIVILPGLLGLGLLDYKLVGESEAVGGQYTYNEVLPLMLARYCGPGLLGLGITALIAGFMAGMAGNVSAFATVWTYDIYRAFMNKDAADRHYVSMGRWCTVLGVFASIGTAYLAMQFASIMDYVQALFSFFIAPLFGTVLLGMLWKRATPAGGFWGLLVGTVSSIAMFTFLHWFPAGYAPLTGRDLNDLGALVAEVESPKTPVTEYIASKLSTKTQDQFQAYHAYLTAKEASTTTMSKFSDLLKEEDKDVQLARRFLTNDLNGVLSDPDFYAAARFADVKLPESAKATAEKELPEAGPRLAAAKTSLHAAEEAVTQSQGKDKEAKSRLSAARTEMEEAESAKAFAKKDSPEAAARLAAAKEALHAAEEAVTQSQGKNKEAKSRLSAARTEMEEADQKVKQINRPLLHSALPNAFAAVRTIEATTMNSKHAAVIALSPKATGMATNMYSALWSWIVCVAVTVLVSLMTRPKPDAELTGLVYGCTVIPSEGDVPLLKRPMFWAIIVAIVFFILNILVW